MVEWAVAGSFYDPVKPADGVLTCFIRGLFPLFSRGWFPGDGVWRVRVRRHLPWELYFKETQSRKGLNQVSGMLWVLQETGIKCRVTVFRKFLEYWPELRKDFQRNAVSPACPLFHLEAKKLGSHCPGHWLQDPTLVKLSSEF